MGFVELRNLTKEFRTQDNLLVAVDQVNLVFQPSQSYAICGPSGCGKTTLLNLTGLLLEPSSGEIVIHDRPVSQITERDKARLRNRFFGLIDQHYMLIEDQSVLDNLLVPFYYAKPRIGAAQRREKILEALEQVGLADRINDRVANLSGGQKQRIAIARALANGAECILADEPTGALDSETGERVLDLLLDRVKTLGATLLLVTHNLELASRCDHILEMADGVIHSSARN